VLLPFTSHLPASLNISVSNSLSLSHSLSASGSSKQKLLPRPGSLLALMLLPMLLSACCTRYSPRPLRHTSHTSAPSPAYIQAASRCNQQAENM
jgi:hypothetical protein